MLYMTTLLVFPLFIFIDLHLHILSALKPSILACSEYHYTSLLTMVLARTYHIPHKIRKWDCTPINTPILEAATALTSKIKNVGSLIQFVLYKSIMLVFSWITRSMFTQIIALTDTSWIRVKSLLPFSSFWQLTIHENSKIPEALPDNDSVTHVFQSLLRAKQELSNETPAYVLAQE